MNNNSIRHLPPHKYLFPISYRAVVIGDSGVGKTSLIKRMSEGIFSDLTQSTIGVDFTHLVSHHQSNWIGKSEIYVWDTAGQEMYNSLVQNYVRNAAVALVLYDVSNKNSFDSLESRWFPQLQKYSYIKPILIGNKSDKPPEVSLEDATGLAKKYNAPFIQISVKTNNQIDAVMLYLHDIIVKPVEQCLKTHAVTPHTLSRDQWFQWSQYPQSEFYQKFNTRVKIIYRPTALDSSYPITLDSNLFDTIFPKCC